MFEQDPRDGLVEGRRGEAAQVGPVALTGRQETRGVDGLLQGEGVALPEDGVRRKILQGVFFSLDSVKGM